MLMVYNLFVLASVCVYVGEAPSNNEPIGPYPVVVQQDNGAKVLVVQDYAYGKYMGHLQLTFDEQGVVTSYGGNPILLDSSIKQGTIDNAMSL